MVTRKQVESLYKFRRALEQIEMWDLDKYNQGTLEAGIFGGEIDFIYLLRPYAEEALKEIEKDIQLKEREAGIKAGEINPLLFKQF